MPLTRFLSRWLRRNKDERENKAEAGQEPPVGDAERLSDNLSPSLSALAELVRIIANPLDEATREGLITYVSDAETDDASSLLDWVLTRDASAPEAIDRSCWCLCISVDWRASYDIERQANELLRTLGISERWTWSSVGDVSATLLSFGEWLSRRDYALLHLDTGHDEYTAFAVRQDDVEKALTLSNAAGAAVLTDEGFRAGNIYVLPGHRADDRRD
ncbi:DUF6630 family protein [Ralstonia pickettii]|uniref:DUF6630 family protein n=1 Tax=Ralstonia pickettii TaxID=329 RepID=UPI0015BB1808|nr:hypothetical protein [Ralstonia pickettii]NWK44787.1 hypothetical protein [Ralstonia pickettii]